MRIWRLHLACLFVLTLTASAQAIDRPADIPSGEDIYAVLAAPPRRLEATDDHPGKWEYVYDVYGGTRTWMDSLNFREFDADQLHNLAPDGRALQMWDGNANLGYSPFLTGRVASPSTWTDASGWTLTGEPYAYLNEWHDGSEYHHGGWYGTPIITPNFASPRGQLGDTDGDGTNDQVIFGNKTTMGVGFPQPSLLMTVRFVHFYAPVAGAVEFWAWRQDNADGTHDNVYTILSGPGFGAFPGDFTGEGDVNAVDIDILCENMGGDPDPYDVDEDGDVDEDDLVYLVENLVEWDNGVDNGVGTKRGDFNLDGVVNATDLAIMKGTFGTSGVGYADGNANCDTVVNATDLAILKGSFGFIAVPSPGGGVPEPVTIGLLSLGSLALLRRRRS